MKRGLKHALALACFPGAIGMVVPCAVRAADAQEADPHFPVMEFRIEGNSVLPALAIERAVYAHLGEHRTIKDVERARTDLEKAYHAAGYLTVLVDIPEQSVEGGVVTLNVTEGKVGRLRIIGSRYYSLGRIRASAPELAEGNVPYFPRVQEELAALNKSADRKVTPVLRPARTPGSVDVDLTVEDRSPLHASIELTNRYSANTSTLRTSASLRYDNLWQRDHSLTLGMQTAPQDPSEVQVISASYLLPLAGSDRLLSLYAVRSKSDVASVGTLNVLGDATIYGARLIVPLPAADGAFHSLALGIDHKRFAETVNLSAGGFQTPITYTPLSLQYTGSRQSEQATTQYTATVNLGLRGFFGNQDEEFANKRFRASANYFAVRGEMQHTRKFARDWSVYGRVEAQIAGQPLISNEQFAAGGGDSVRGYLEAERFGDHALRASFELRSPALGEGAGPLASARLHAFVDAAELMIIDPLPDTPSHFSLASLGIGMRARPAKGLSLDLDLADPRKDGAFAKRGDTRIHFRLAYEF